jgi:lysozyme
MNISQNGIDLIQHFEGCRLDAYLDSVGVPTIGYGCTKDVKLGDSITQEQADVMFLAEISKFEKGVESLVHVDISQNQFDALVSFAYNLGLGSLASSTLLRIINAGSPEAAADQFLRWDHAGGQQLAGLTARREAERKLFLGESWNAA